MRLSVLSEVFAQTLARRRIAQVLQPTLSRHSVPLRMKGAFFHGPELPLTIKDVELDQPQHREVVIQTVASGVFHRPRC